MGRDSRASSPELARRPIPARKADNAFDPVQRTGLTIAQTSEESLLYPQVSRSSVVDQSWERIGVTGNHPIWSDDRHDYVAAQDLRVGERLKNLSGDTVYVQQKLPRPDQRFTFECLHSAHVSALRAFSEGDVTLTGGSRPPARRVSAYE